MVLSKRLLGLLLTGLVILSSGCTEQLGTLSLTPSNAKPAVQQIDRENGNVELILESMDVWDGKGATESISWTLGEHELYFRHRPKDTFEQAWVRLGLFWHSRLEKIILTAVVLGDPVDIRGIKIKAGLSTATLKKTKDFKYTPTKRAFDKILSSGAFHINPRTLKAMVYEEDAYITLLTNRGQLKVNLSAVPKVGVPALKTTTKYMFAEFLRQQGAIANKS